MAVYFLRSKHISRSNGSRATRAAAYRTGERIRNEATSEVEVTPDGLGARTSLEVSGRQRYLMGIPGSSRDEYLSCRVRRAELSNPRPHRREHDLER
jgi:hypothetical protein